MTKKGKIILGVIIALILILVIYGLTSGNSGKQRCSVCHGTGYYQNKTCVFCHGTGYSDSDARQDIYEQLYD